MASPEVAVAFPLSGFDKFNGPRSMLRTAQSIPAGAAAFADINVWPAAAAAAAAAAADLAPLEFEDHSCTLSLPVIDLEGLSSGDTATRERIVREVGTATEEWGFFQVVNHGVPEELVQRVHDEARNFFDLPLDEKKRAQILGHNPRSLGFSGTFAKIAVNTKIPIKESLADFRSPSAPVAALAAKIWPDGNPAFSNTLEEHCSSVEALGHQLLEVLAESLGLQRNFFSRHFKVGGNSIGTWRLHHFPPNPAPSTVWRTVPHSDPSVLTILKQDVGGLQIKKPGGGIWIDVHPLQGSFVVNVGDILEAWSNGRFPSVEHRVALSEDGERFSTVNFLDAAPAMAIQSPPELIDEDHPSLYRPFIAGDFRANFEKIKRLGDIRKGKALDYVRRPTPL